jgi:tetratricopeptide (TPR) repeat protein
VAAAVAVCFAGCAVRGAPENLTDRFVSQGEAAMELPGPSPSTALGEATFEEIKRAVKEARPLPRQPVPTLESQDRVIAAGLSALTKRPNSDAHRHLGDAYLRMRVRDAAFEQYSRAIELNRKNASAFDGRARIWRDWGFPNFGLGDAYRAIAAAPRSPIPYNTLGTIFLRLGQQAFAREAFEQAVALDSSAAYAVDNLCATAPANPRCNPQ